MSKLLHFGMRLDDIVERATATPARILGYDGTVGTLKPGTNADIALIERRNGKGYGITLGLRGGGAGSAPGIWRIGPRGGG